jgi:hypothetical protein
MVQEETLSRLDDLLANLEHEHNPDCRMLREHLQGARSYLLGAMPAEYKLNLRLAEHVLGCVGNEELRQKLRDFIHAR